MAFRREARNAERLTSVAYDVMRGTSFLLLVSWFMVPHHCSRVTDGIDCAVGRNSASGGAVHLPSKSARNDEGRDPKVEAPIPPESPALRAGVYRLTLVADHGSREGGSSEGLLTLVTASATDKSPITGEIAKDAYEPPLFYGWTELDFGRVAAPVCREPDPASRDPVRPGVVVPARTHLDRQLVLIGTVWSLRDGFLSTDGCGIALQVEGSEAGCYRGSWNRWGLAANGSGTFEACSIRQASSP